MNSKDVFNKFGPDFWKWWDHYFQTHYYQCRDHCSQDPKDPGSLCPRMVMWLAVELLRNDIKSLNDRYDELTLPCADLYKCIEETVVDMGADIIEIQDKLGIENGWTKREL